MIVLRDTRPAVAARRWGGRIRRPVGALMLAAGLIGLLLVLAGCQADTGQWQALNFPFPTSDTIIVSMTPDPDVPQLFFGGTSNGQVLRLRIESLGAVTGAGLPSNAAVSSLYADPHRAGRLLAGTSRGVYQSTDYGDSWHPYGSGLPADDGIDALVAGSGNGDTLFAGSEQHGVYVSHDGGATWTAASAGLPDNVNVYGLTFDATSNTLYAALVAHGVYASTDGGQNWAARGGDVMGQSDAFVVLVSPPASGAAGKGKLFAGTSKGLFTSVDSGQTWQAARLNNTRVIALASDPTSAATLYAGTSNANNSAGTVYRSTDAGAHWAVLAPGLAHPVASIVVLKDKQNHPVVFAAAGLILRYPALGGATGGPLSTIVTIVLFLGIVVLLYWVLRRTRRQLLGPVPSMRPQPGPGHPPLTPTRSRLPRTTTTGQVIPPRDDLAEQVPNPWSTEGAESGNGSAARHPELN